MKITFYGAAHEVTGSCHLVETSTKKILFDCGMFQGSNFSEGQNHEDFPFDPSEVDILLVSHAHLDHTGRVPKLVRDGFNGKIYMTKATCELARIIWDDAYKIMQYNKKKFELPILYDTTDIERSTELCHGLDYEEELDLGDGIKVKFKDAGHIFGAAFIELTADGKTIAYSGDIGNVNVPILRETTGLGDIDVLLCESTYGDRLHETEEERNKILLDLIKEGCKRGGTIMMPAFSIERTQEILYRLDELKEHDKTLPDIQIFVDSPMAINALPVYKKYTEYYDAEAKAKFVKGDDFFDFEGLTLTPTVNDSKKINNVKGVKMVMAGAGMMNGGRILHHALRYLSDPKSTLIIVGYQAYGTLGRRLYEGAERVTVMGKQVEVKCTIKAIGALSAHGDQKKLMNWINGAKTKPKKVYFIHGESNSATVIAHKVRDELGIDAFVPELGESAEI